MKQAILVLTITLLTAARPATSQHLESPLLCNLCSYQLDAGATEWGPTAGALFRAGLDSGNPGSTAGAITGGLIGGAVGAVVLGYLGYQLGGGGDICGDDSCGFVGGIMGGLFGEMIGMGIGVHIGNGRHGSLAADIGVALAAPFVAGGLASQLHTDLGVPVAIGAQIALTVAVERGARGIHAR